METIADVEAFEKTPLTEQFPHTDSYNLIMASAKRFSDKAALEFLLQGLPDEPAKTISFAELGAQVTRTANLLHDLGVGADDASLHSAHGASYRTMRAAAVSYLWLHYSRGSCLRGWLPHRADDTWWISLIGGDEEFLENHRAFSGKAILNGPNCTHGASGYSRRRY